MLPAMPLSFLVLLVVYVLLALAGGYPACWFAAGLIGWANGKA